MIEDYIPCGYENRISRSELRFVTGMTDRDIREQISEAVIRGVLIASKNGGYFRRRDERDDGYIRAYIMSELNRAKSQSRKNYYLRREWGNIHPEELSRKKCKEQIDGQMSFNFS